MQDEDTLPERWREETMHQTYFFGVMARHHRPAFAGFDLPAGLGRIRSLATEHLVAVVSSYAGSDLTSLDHRSLLQLLTIHQRIIEHAMRTGPVLPAKFGTLLASGSDLLAGMRRADAMLVNTLQRFTDLVEIELAVTWELPRVFAEIAREPEVAALAAASRTSRDFIAAQAEVGKLVKATLDHRRADLLESITAALAPFADDVRPNQLPVDELVLNTAFLIERHRLDSFYRRIHQLDETFDGTLSFRTVGPLPPYSFATVDAVRLPRRQLEADRRLFELGECVSEAALASSFRQLAWRAHPDLHPDDPGASDQFAALTEARERLARYLRSRIAEGGEPARGGGYELDTAGSGEIVILSVTRNGAELDCEGAREHDRLDVAI